MTGSMMPFLPLVAGILAVVVQTGHLWRSKADPGSGTVALFLGGLVLGSAVLLAGSFLRPGLAPVLGYLGFGLGLTSLLGLSLVCRGEGTDTYRAMFLNSRDIVVLLDVNNRITDMNPVGLETLGTTLERIKSRPLHEVFPDDSYPLDQDAQISGKREIDLFVSGRRRSYEISVSPLYQGTRLNGRTLVSRDITDAKSYRKQLENLAYCDGLTGLLNRRYFEQAVVRALKLARREGWSMALVYLDLDKFKPINDRHGHHIGDLLLCEVGRRLEDAVRESDIVARIGGDEFAILLYQADYDTVTSLCRRMVRALERSFLAEGTEMAVDGSLGMAFYPRDGASFSELFRHADASMYQVKQSKVRLDGRDEHTA